MLLCSVGKQAGLLRYYKVGVDVDMQEWRSSMPARCIASDDFSLAGASTCDLCAAGSYWSGSGKC